MQFSILAIHKPRINGELAGAYLSLGLKNFALSMIGIFVPIYLMTLGHSLKEALLYIASTYATVILVCLFFSGFLISKLGLKHTIAFSMPFSIANIVLLYLLPHNPMSIYGIAAIGGIGQALYWVPFNTDFAKNTNEKTRGRESSWLFGISRSSIMLGPIIGALILKFYDFNMLFGTVIAAMVVSAIPMLSGRDIKEASDFTMKKIVSEEHRKYFFRFIFEGALHISEWMLWPLAVYLLLASTLDVGAVGSLANLGLIILALFIGELSDNVNRKALIRIGGLFYGVLWLARGMANSPGEVFLASVFAGLFYAMISIPLLAKATDKAVRENVLEFMIFREIMLAAGRVIALIWVAYAASFASTLFNIGAIASMGFLLI